MILSAVLGLGMLMPSQSIVATDSVTGDADDPAIWVCKSDRSKSIVIGTDKVAKTGALVVFGLDGKTLQTISNLDQPNNVDVQTRFRAGNQWLDIAVTTERGKNRLRIFKINPKSGKLSEISGKTDVFSDAPERWRAPMGIALYRRTNDGCVFAIISRKDGPPRNYLHQYRLQYNPKTTQIDIVKVREFGIFSGKEDIEAIAVDDYHGFVYYSDETYGVRKYHADPQSQNAYNLLRELCTTGWKGDQEGIALYEKPGGDGMVVVTDQQDGNSIYRAYDRRSNRFLGEFSLGADATDGIEICSDYLGEAFPNGMIAVMNSSGKNFFLVRWDHIRLLPLGRSAAPQ